MPCSRGECCRSLRGAGPVRRTERADGAGAQPARARQPEGCSRVCARSRTWRRPSEPRAPGSRAVGACQHRSGTVPRLRSSPAEIHTAPRRLWLAPVEKLVSAEGTSVEATRLTGFGHCRIKSRLMDGGNGRPRPDWTNLPRRSCISGLFCCLPATDGAYGLCSADRDRLGAA